MEMERNKINIQAIRISQQDDIGCYSWHWMCKGRCVSFRAEWMPRETVLHAASANRIMAVVCAKDLDFAYQLWCHLCTSLLC